MNIKALKPAIMNIIERFEFVAVTVCTCISSYGSLRNEIFSKFHVDVRAGMGGGGEGSDLNLQWTLSGALWNISTSP